MTSTIESVFLNALKCGPVLLLDNMGDQTHAATNDPLTSNSPLIRLAILAVDLGADPDLLRFNSFRRVAGMTEEQCADTTAVMYNVGADCPELTHALQFNAPIVGFHYCSLNAMYFLDEVGVFGQRIKTHRAKVDNEHVRESFAWIEPQPARFDRTLKHHMRVAELVGEHFERQGWVTAAERLAKCMVPAEPALLEPAAVSARAVGLDAVASGDTVTFTTRAHQRPTTVADTIPLADQVWFCRYAAQPISEVEKWSPEKFQRHMEVLVKIVKSEWSYPEDNTAPPAAVATDVREAKREFAEHVFITDGIRDAAARAEPRELASELQAAINRCSVEGGSNTPDFILAEMLSAQLAAFNHAVQERAKWYGRMDKPGQHRPEPEQVSNIRDTNGIGDAQLAADIAALNQYLIDEHASDNPDGTPKVGPSARAPMPGERGLAAALRLLKLAALRGAFFEPSSFHGQSRADSLSLAAWLKTTFAPGLVDERAEYRGESFRISLAAQVRSRLELALARGAFLADFHDRKANYRQIIAERDEAQAKAKIDARDMADLRATISALQIRVETAEDVVARARRSASCRELLGLSAPT